MPFIVNISKNTSFKMLWKKKIIIVVKKKKKHIKNGQISKGNEQHGYLYEKINNDQNESFKK